MQPAPAPFFLFFCGPNPLSSILNPPRSVSMQVDQSVPVATAAQTDSVVPWYKLLNRYHWYVLAVAALGWLFDCMDQRIFMVSRQQALTELLGYKYEEGKLVTHAGQPLAEAASKEAVGAIGWYSGLATAIFMIGWATGGLVFGIMGDRWGRARTMLL